MSICRYSARFMELSVIRHFLIPCLPPQSPQSRTSSEWVSSTRTVLGCKRGFCCCCFFLPLSTGAAKSRSCSSLSTEICDSESLEIDSRSWKSKSEAAGEARTRLAGESFAAVESCTVNLLLKRTVSARDQTMVSETHLCSCSSLSTSTPARRCLLLCHHLCLLLIDLLQSLCPRVNLIIVGDLI